MQMTLDRKASPNPKSVQRANTMLKESVQSQCMKINAQENQ